MNPSLRKAAILVTVLDPDAADQLLEQMGEQQAARVRSAAMELPDIDFAEQEAVLAEFFGRPAADSEVDGGVELELSASSHPPAPHSADEQQPLGFEFLQNASGQELARKLAREHPQLIAVVVANLAAEKAAELLERLPRHLRDEVLDRLADLDDADAETLTELHRALKQVFLDAYHAPRQSGRRHDHLQSILSHLRRNSLRDQSPSITVQSPPRPRSVAEPATRPAPVIAFDQILSLGTSEFFAVFDQADPRVVMLALAGAPRRLFERYLAQFSTERALEFERHVEQLRPLRLRDVEAAQRELAILASSRQQAADSAAEKSRRFAAAA
jgi:flagellar motor switch protein FliG